MKTVALATLILFSAAVQGAPVASGEADGVKVVLFNDPCEHKDVVSNLPYKATWTEKGVTYTGCYGMSPLRLIMSWFKEDKTVAVFPLQFFKPVTNT